MKSKIDQNSQLIPLKDYKWMERQRYAGKCVSKCLKSFNNLIKKKPDNLSLFDIESQCVEIIEDFGCIPTFYKYRGFPGRVCLSVNEGLVHGVPSDYVLKEGDVVTLDLGATYEGAIADAAYTCIYGENSDKRVYEMLNLCKYSLEKAINFVKVGEKIGKIGDVIYKTTKNNGFGLIVDYGGHGIDYNKPHSKPFVANKSSPQNGPVMQPGMSIAVEPMLVLKQPQTWTLGDNWTIVSPSVGCHFEHSVTINPDGETEVITEHFL